MFRAIRLVLGAAAVLFGGVLLAQPKDPPKEAPKDAPKEAAKDAPKDAPKNPPAENYFPLRKDGKWTYKVGDNFVEVKVTKVEKVGAEEQYTLETYVGKDAKTSEVIVVRSDGIYRTKVKDDKLDPAVKILPLPPKKDDKGWEVNSKLGAQTVKGTLKVADENDQITVLGTKYDTIRVEGKDLDVAGAKTSVKTWYAKNKGIVKVEFVLQTGDKVTEELKSYETGEGN